MIRQFPFTPALEYAQARLPRRFFLVFIMLALAVGTGLLTAAVGFFAVPIVGGIFTVVLLLLVGYNLFYYLWIFILMGYLFMGKGFAYAGVNPLFISEVVIGLGVLSVVLIPFSDRLKVANRYINWVMIPLIVYVGWSSLRTFPYVGTYQLDAVRDGMLFGYAIYSFLIFLLVSRENVERFISILSRILPYFVLISPLLFVFSFMVEIPIRFPGSPVSILEVKAGDAGVHLGGIAAFMLLRLDRYNRPWSNGLLWLMWICWVISWLMFGAFNRGGMVSASLAVALVLVLRPKTIGWYRPMIIALLGISLLIATNLYSAFNIQLGNSRSLSAEQIVNNLASIIGVGGEEYGNLDDTKAWRIGWWNKITDYTFNGPYFWNGKGYGINLAVDDGAYSVKRALEKGTRSPHNVFMTILARSGVPGLALWVVFLVAYFINLLRYVIPKDTEESKIQSKYAIWLIAYSAAFVCNSNFDVFLEGPMGGIWFWTLVGISFILLHPIKQSQGQRLVIEPARTN